MREKGVSLLSDENRVSSGDLNSTFSPPDKAFEKSIEPLELANIAHFSDIPDFIEPTHSPYPIIVKSPSSIQCIDGWELIEQAKHRGETSLTCEIIHILHDSEIDVAIWKASVRTMPPGGTCIYPEKVGNTCRLFMMLYESTENPVIFSHGGDRRGDSYPNCPENNIRHMLKDRLGKELKTINKYLNHGEFICDEAMQDLINARVKKGFFEAIQRDKQGLIDELKAEQKSPDEIVKAVSDRVISWFEEFQTGGPAEIVIPQTDQEETPANEIQPQQNVAPPPSVKPIEHKHWPGNPSAALEKQPTEDEIIQEFKNIGHSLIETAENQKLTTSERIELFFDQIIRQSKLIQDLKHLLTQQNDNSEEQC
jgi:hypothetical protein